MPTSRPYEAVPPEAADVLRPVLPGLADETIAAIAREVPGYARAMEGEFGQAVRLGVEIAFSRFLDLLAAPEPQPAESARIYVDLGRGEFHAGRSLDALLAAYRVGARLAWRRFVEAGVAGGLAAEAIYALGEAIFAYIDELSAESAEGYAEEQTAAAGRERAAAAPARAAADAGAAAEPGGDPHGGHGGGLDAPPRRRRRPRRGHGRARRAGRGAARLRRRAARAPARRGRGRRGGLRAPRSSWSPTPTRPGGGAGSSPRRRSSPWRSGRPSRGPRPRRARAGRAPPTRSPPPGACPRRRTARRGSSSPRSTSRICCSRPRPTWPPTSRRRGSRRSTELAEGPRARLEETLAAWLDRPGQVQAVAAAIGVHPQTVRYRVRQLRDLFGERLEDPEARFELSLALRARG